MATTTSLVDDQKDLLAQKRLIGPSLQADDVRPIGGIGPALPVHVFKSRLVESDSHAEGFGRPLEEDPSVIGPLAPGQEFIEEVRHIKSHSAAENTEKPTVRVQRDAWMTQLLPASKHMAALKPRKFQLGQSSAPSGDSEWFKTPGVDSQSTLEDHSRQLKQTLSESQDSRDAVEYNQKMATVVAHCEKEERKTSLLDMHTKKQQKDHVDKPKRSKKNGKEKKEKEAKKKRKKHKHNTKEERESERKGASTSVEPTRIPFDRDNDLKVSRVDPVARQALIERSKKLSSRFGHGSRQYL